MIPQSVDLIVAMSGLQRSYTISQIWCGTLLHSNNMWFAAKFELCSELSLSTQLFSIYIFYSSSVVCSIFDNTFAYRKKTKNKHNKTCAASFGSFVLIKKQNFAI